VKQFFYKGILSSVLLFTSISVHAFTDMNGKKDDITNHIGKNKWTIVEVWESNCHLCRVHMPDLVKFDGKLKNARILGISLDGQAGVEAAEAFISEYDIKFPNMLSNPIEMNIWMQQNLEESLIGTPTFMLFDDKGFLVAAQPGVVSVESLEKFITENSKPVKTKKEVKNKNNVQTKNTSTKTNTSEYVFDGVSD